MTTNIILPDTFAIANPVTPYSAGNPKWNSLSSRNGWGLQSWQLDAGHFQPAAKQAMQLVFPRPDSETSALSYHRNGTVGVPMEIPIGIGFGLYPFYARILDGPAGATVGGTYADDDYLVIKYTPAANGSNNFLIRVTGQDLNYVDIAFSVEVSDTGLVYAAGSGSDDTGTGTPINPYRSLQTAYANAAGRCIGLFTGDYSVIDVGYSLTPTTAMGVFGVPGETVNIDCSANTTEYGATRFNSSDVFIGGFRFHNLQNTAANMRYFYSSGEFNRVSQYNIHFDGGAVGIDDNDNCSCFFLNAAYGAQRTNLMQSHCRFTNLPYSNNGFSSFDLYEVSRFLHQFNTYDGENVSKSRYCAWVKAWSLYDICIRHNTMESTWDNSFMAIAGTEDQERVEVSYNLLKNSYAAEPNQNHPLVDLAYNYVRPGTIDITRGPYWFFRNTVYGEPIIKEYSTNYPLVASFENDVIIHNQTFAGATHKVMMYNNNDAGSVRKDPQTRERTTLTIGGTECHGVTTDGIVDANLELTGAYAQYTGTRGHVIG